MPRLAHATLALFAFALLALAAFSYGPALHGEFYLDDVLRIVEFRPVHGGLAFSILDDYRQGVFHVLQSVMPDRPFLIFSIWLNYLWGDVDPFGYKLVNVALHALNAGVLAWFFLEVSDFYGRTRRPLLAALLALLFFVHPLNTQAVTMVIQRGVLLSFLFGFLSLIFSLRFLASGRTVYFWAALLVQLVGILCKQNDIILPFFVLLFAFSARRTRNAGWIAAALFLISLVPAVFYLFFRDNFFPQSTSAGNWLTYGYTQSFVIFHYLRQVLLPYGLNPVYDIPRRLYFWRDFTWLLSIIHLSAIFYFFRAALRGNWVGAAGAAFYVALIPESSFFPITHVVFDHRMYLPMAFLGLALYTGGEKLGKPLVVPLIAAICVLAVLTRVRNVETQSYEGWMKVSVEHYDQDPSSNSVLLCLLLFKEKNAEGLAIAERLARKYPNVPDYPVFLTLFRQPEDPYSYLFSVLTSPAYAGLSLGTRLNLTSRLIDYYRGEWVPPLGDEYKRLELIHLTLFPQADLLKTKDGYYPLVRAYERNLRELNESYLARAENSPLDPYQFELWESVLAEIAAHRYGNGPSEIDVSHLPLWLRWTFEQRDGALGRHRFYQVGEVTLPRLVSP